MDFPKFFDDRLPSRLWAKLRENEITRCWEWIGAKTEKGYGIFKCGGKKRLAHRVFYEALIGPIPAGLQIDHLCRVRNCSNPAHLEPVTHLENQLRSPISILSINIRKTHCPKGHPYSAENVRRHPIRGERMCVTCTRETERRCYRKAKQIGATP